MEAKKGRSLVRERGPENEAFGRQPGKLGWEGSAVHMKWAFGEGETSWGRNGSRGNVKAFFCKSLREKRKTPRMALSRDQT